MNYEKELNDLKLQLQIVEKQLLSEKFKSAGLEESCKLLRNRLSESSQTGRDNRDSPNYSDFKSWLQIVKAENGTWKGSPLVVLSLFDGLGALWQALSDLGIPFEGYSSEIEPKAIELVRYRWPAVKHVGDVVKLEKENLPERIDLVVGGFPCQDLSGMNKTRRGLHGSRSGLFFHLLRILQECKPKWFLVENVGSMMWLDREEIGKYLGVVPVVLDSAELSPQRRRRLFWTNLTIPKAMPPLRDHPSTQLQAFLTPGAIALCSKSNCVMVTNFNPVMNGAVGMVVREGEGVEGGSGEGYMGRGLRNLYVAEIEAMFGLPQGYTLLPKSTLSLLSGGRPSRGPTSRTRGDESGGQSKESRDGWGGDQGGGESGGKEKGPSWAVEADREKKFDVIELSSDSEGEGGNGGDCGGEGEREGNGEDVASANEVSPGGTLRTVEVGQVRVDCTFQEASFQSPVAGTGKAYRLRPRSERKIEVDLFPDSKSAVGDSAVASSTKKRYTVRKSVKRSTVKREYSNEPDWKDRWKLLGNSFSVQVMSFLLSGLLLEGSRLPGSLSLPYVVPRHGTEEACGIFLKGELWALHNLSSKPNWYAFIESREGGRFSKVNSSSKKLEIKLQYLELTPKYCQLEGDWDPKKETGGFDSKRGTGLYRISRSCTVSDNAQDSFDPFSHRVKAYLKLDNETFFIFPSPNSVWAILEGSSVQFVYVRYSHFNSKEVENWEVGKEEFEAIVSYLVFVKTSEYIISDEEFPISGISKFFFEAPFMRKNDAKTIIVEAYSDKKRQVESESDEENPEESIVNFLSQNGNSKISKSLRSKSKVSKK